MEKLTDEAAEREPDHVTPAEYLGIGALHSRTFGELDESDGLTPEQIETDRQATGLDDADDHFVIGQTSAGWPGTDLPPTEVIHFDAGRVDQYAACGFDLDRNGPDGWTTDRAQVTCSLCTGKLVDEQLAEPDRRTVSLEVLTDELCRPNPVPVDARVGVVLRLNGEPVSIISAYDPAHDGSPAEVLYKLLRVAHDAAQSAIDPDLGGELQMPGADVLAALDGRPDAQLLTAPVHVLALDVDPGMLLAPVGDPWRQLVTATGPCTQPDCEVGASCVVLVVNTGEEHRSGYARTRVVIPMAATR